MLNTKDRRRYRRSNELLEQAQNLLREGLGQVRAQGIVNPQSVDYFLFAASEKALQLSEAIALLCEHEMAAEAGPTLRSLVELCMNMRWIMHRDSATRVNEYLSDLKREDLGGGWTKVPLEKRMAQIGMSSAYHSFIVKSLHLAAHVNARSLNLNQFQPGGSSGPRGKPSPVLQVTAQMLCNAMRALDSRYLGFFSGHVLISAKIRGNPNPWKQWSLALAIRRKLLRELQSDGS